MQLLDSVNPLIPNLSMYILLTVFHIFLMVLDGRICLNIDSSSLVIISFILVTCMFWVVTLKGEIKCLSPFGFKGLTKSRGF